MPLRKRNTSVQAAEGPAGTAADDKKATKQSKRHRLLAFFRSGRKRKAADNDATPIPVRIDKSSIRKPARDSKIAESTKPAKSSSSVEVQNAGGGNVEEQQGASATPPPKPEEKPSDEPKVELLHEENIHTLFSGAPHFFVKQTGSRLIPSTSYPWDEELLIRDVSDSVPFAQPAFSAATLHRHLPKLQQAADQEKLYQGYNLNVVEVPSMLSAQGLEVGSIGFDHFLQLPRSDNLVTDLQQSQTSNDYLEAVKNKELMRTHPPKLGIRAVDMNLVYDRLVELGDLFEAFHDSPERMTILNNQTSGDLYANLFGKFLTPPGYDGSVDDPTGIKVQIDALLKVLRLKGVWVDFSLVEWRIRLGQILWNEQDVEAEDASDLWTDRDKLLLQITLACELLLRLDAITSMEAEDAKTQMHVNAQDLEGFENLKTRKTDWDLVLARRFLENILVVKENNVGSIAPAPTSRGLLSILGPSAPQEVVKPDVVFLPQHQSRQLTGLLNFAQTLHWPNLDGILSDLATKLGASEAGVGPEQSTLGKFLNPSTPSAISVYATPLGTPRSPGQGDSYFGNQEKPSLNRTNSLQVPLSSTLLAHSEESQHALNVGGWLSRSYLTGLILPGEAISHFLMSTLLENDKQAIASLGDSANLYGGFVYAGRTWWSKASIVGRVLGCMDGAAESMGWISFANLPEGLADGWYAINSEQLASEQPPRISAENDPVLRDSAIIPGFVGDVAPVHPDDLVFPRDAETPPIPAVEFIRWDLTPINMDLIHNDAASSPSLAAETYIASVAFKSYAGDKKHTFSLTHDVQFVTSWPCTPPSASPPPGLPQILKRAQTQTLSRTSSMRSSSNRSSRHLSRRNSHGFEPLLSHPPESPSVGPTRMYFPEPDEVPRLSPSPRPQVTKAHPLHASYKYKLVPGTDVLDPGFVLPFTMHSRTSQLPPTPDSSGEAESSATDDTKTILILDTRASKDLELLARSWCAEKGLHALIGRVGRTCLACCVREARGLGINVVIRV